MPLTNSQVDRLGDRLRAAAESDEQIPEGDRQLLLEFRASFLPAYQAVAQRIRDTAGMNPSGRPEKTPESIIAKLCRERTQLSRMQDIAGCRVVVPTKARQEEVLGALRDLFPDRREMDRRAEPRYGYRAVHLIVREQGRPVEIQLRTRLQDLWANVVEGTSVYGGDLKHGVEPPEPGGLLRALEHASETIASLEDTGVDGEIAGRPAERLIEVEGSLAEAVREGLLATYHAGLFWGIMSSALKYRSEGQ